MVKVITIAKVGWFVDYLPPHLGRDWILDHLWYFHEFLRENDLLVHPLVATRLEVDNDDFAIRSNDLTVEGLAVVREGYDRWCKALDRGTAPSKTTILEKALVNVRSRT